MKKDLETMFFARKDVTAYFLGVWELACRHERRYYCVGYYTLTELKITENTVTHEWTVAEAIPVAGQIMPKLVNEQVFTNAREAWYNGHQRMRVISRARYNELMK